MKLLMNKEDITLNSIMYQSSRRQLIYVIFNTTSKCGLDLFRTKFVICMIVIMNLLSLEEYP
jgi:hypothetical protein